MSGKTTLLAVDDDKDVLYTLEAIGATVGWRIYAETNSIAAVQRLKKVKPDLILMDYHMPQQNGILTVRQMRQIDSKVPIIVLTVDDRQAIANAFLDAGANDFATKPIKVPDLVARIQVHIRLLEKQREMQEKFLVNKTINEATLELVYEYCRSTADWFYIEEVAQHTGLAYQTTVRYLKYLLAQDQLAVVSDYGKVGRPRNKYKYTG